MSKDEFKSYIEKNFIIDPVENFEEEMKLNKIEEWNFKPLESLDEEFDIKYLTEYD